MPKPVTPLVGCDVFVLNEKREVLLIKRADNGFWALPGGCHDLGETPRACAERECKEESGYLVKVTELLGVYSRPTIFISKSSCCDGCKYFYDFDI